MGNQKSKKSHKIINNDSNNILIKNQNLSFSNSQTPLNSIRIYRKINNKKIKSCFGNKINKTNSFINSPKEKNSIKFSENELQKDLESIHIKLKNSIKNEEIISKVKYTEVNISLRSNVSENSSMNLLNQNNINRAYSFLNKMNKEKYKKIFSFENQSKLNKKIVTYSESNFIKSLYDIGPSYNLPQLTKKASLQTFKDIFIKHLKSGITKNSKNIDEDEDEEIYEIEDDNENHSIERIRGLFIKKPKNFKYIGFKINNIKTNFGIVLWEDHHKLIGNFSNNKIDNFCRFSNNKNSKFEGHYINNKPNGYGIFTSSKNKTVIEGEWKNDEINGIGIQMWNDSSIFFGEFNKQKKNGIGTYKWDDGTLYKGQFNNNNIEGYGIFNYYDGKSYEGELSNGDLNGFGIFTWNNGKKYLGFYKDGYKEGFGIYLNSLNKYLNCIIGFWFKGKINGPCIIIKRNIIFYKLFKYGIIIKEFKSGVMCLKFLNKGNKQYWNLFNMSSNRLISLIKNLVKEKKSLKK